MSTPPCARPSPSMRSPWLTGSRKFCRYGRSSTTSSDSDVKSSSTGRAMNCDARRIAPTCWRVCASPSTTSTRSSLSFATLSLRTRRDSRSLSATYSPSGRRRRSLTCSCAVWPPLRVRPSLTNWRNCGGASRNSSQFSPIRRASHPLSARRQKRSRKSTVTSAARRSTRTSLARFAART